VLKERSYASARPDRHAEA